MAYYPKDVLLRVRRLVRFTLHCLAETEAFGDTCGIYIHIRHHIMNTLQMPKLVGLPDVARALDMTPESMRTLRWKIKKGLADPRRLPCPLDMGGRPKWTQEIIDDWLKERRGVATGPAKPAGPVMAARRTGRPRKSDLVQISLY